MWVQILLFTMLFNYKLIKDIQLFTINFNQFNFVKLFYFNYIFIFQHTPSKINLLNLSNYLYLTTKIFFKKKNFNKLYINNDYLFLTPGVVLKFNNLFKKSLKIKTSLWNLFFIMFVKINSFKHIWMINNFFFNLSKILRNLIKFNLVNSFIYLNFFKKKFFLKKNSIRRIKKWVKKKYFKVVI